MFVIVIHRLCTKMWIRSELYFAYRKIKENFLVCHSLTRYCFGLLFDLSIFSVTANTWTFNPFTKYLSHSIILQSSIMPGTFLACQKCQVVLQIYARKAGFKEGPYNVKCTSLSTLSSVPDSMTGTAIIRHRDHQAPHLLSHMLWSLHGEEDTVTFYQHVERMWRGIEPSNTLIPFQTFYIPWSEALFFPLCDLRWPLRPQGSAGDSPDLAHSSGIVRDKALSPSAGSVSWHRVVSWVNRPSGVWSLNSSQCRRNATQLSQCLHF